MERPVCSTSPFVFGNCQFLFPFLHHFDNPAGINDLNVGGSGNIESDAGSLTDLESGNIADGSNDQKKKKGNAIVNVETKYKGKWEVFTENAGVSAMHLVLLPKIDQALMFDATVWKQSKIKLPGPPCRVVEGTNEQDCFCHSVLLDTETAKIRPLRVHFCSTGGYNNGSDTVRILDICPNCDWQEYPGALGNGRWYATQVTLGDGIFMVFGGRNFPTYEFVPPEGQRNAKNQVFPFKLLAETHDAVENNLYPFV
ncbi:hypothetical protein CRYUN_Cryun26dG0062500 [Craigia yunnanensis]